MKILLVEDEVDLAESFVRFLRISGHDCVTAVNVQQAIDSVALYTPELVITDFCLPDGDGYDVTRHVCQKLPETPVIFMSGNQRPGMEEAARRAGATAYLLKPFSLNALKKEIDTILQTRLP